MLHEFFILGISLNYLNTNYKENGSNSGTITTSLGEYYIYSESYSRKYDFSDFYFDFGFLYKTKYVSFGGVYHSGFKVSGELFESYEDLSNPEEKWKNDDKQFNTSSIRFGLEYVLLAKENFVVPLRAGYFKEDRIVSWFVGADKPKMDGWSIGSGLTFKNFQFDFAYVKTEGNEKASGSYNGIDS